MGNCFASAPHLDLVNGGNILLHDPQNSACTSRQRSSGAVREGPGYLKRRGEAGSKGSHMKRLIHPAPSQQGPHPGMRKESFKRTSVSVGDSEAAMPQSQSAGLKEAEPAAPAAVGVDPDAERAGGKDVGEAKEAGPSAKEARREVENAEVGGPPDTRPEPANQRAPLTVEEGKEPVRGGRCCSGGEQQR
ncbi:hypothetical protein AAFF_G00122270 [Aldrovandia affinis]|uniref:Uncharacterized protein n=1 Tax=Aldrovandia affinis TaxID=143900 RepID=A0AAD7RRY4_9TELE|nr:hypothetical protein AAFF_G00122270 [Aldrovandia affinis]